MVNEENLINDTVEKLLNGKIVVPELKDAVSGWTILSALKNLKANIEDKSQADDYELFMKKMIVGAFVSQLWVKFEPMVYTTIFPANKWQKAWETFVSENLRIQYISSSSM